MKKYGLTDEQVRNIKIFLQRTNLSGEEVAAFNQVTAILNQPIKDPAPEEVIKNSPTDLLLNELSIRDDWNLEDLQDLAPDDEGINDEEIIQEPEQKIEEPKRTYKVKKSSLMNKRNK